MCFMLNIQTLLKEIDEIKFNFKNLMAVLINLLAKCFVKWTYQLRSEISIITNKNGFFVQKCALYRTESF